MHLQVLIIGIMLLFLLINTVHSSNIAYSERIHTTHTESWSQQDKNDLRGGFHHDTHNLADYNLKSSIEYGERQFGREEPPIVDNTSELDDYIAVKDTEISKYRDSSDNNIPSPLQNIRKSLKGIIQFSTMIVQSIGFSVCLYFCMSDFHNRIIPVQITIIMIGGDMLINLGVGTIILIVSTSHDLDEIGHPRFMFLFTLAGSFFIVLTIALWISRVDQKVSLISTILALFFSFFEVISVIGFFDKSSSGFVKLFGDAFFESIATPIFAFLWIPMLVLPIFYDFVFSESYSLHPLCWATVCLGILFFVLMIFGWKVYRDKHSKAILLMDLLVSFASTALVAGLWLCHNQALRISMMVLGGIGLIVFVVLLVVLNKKPHKQTLPIDVISPVPNPPVPGTITYPEPKPKPKSILPITPKPPAPSPKLKPPKPYITTPDGIKSLCIIGTGGFGQVLLVQIPGIEEPCVFKKMLQQANEQFIKNFKTEFKIQRKMFEKCSKRIPKPQYIFNFLNKKLIGTFGFTMEFCRGGSISEFAKLWCVNRTSRISDEKDSDSQRSIDEEDSSSTSYSDDDIYPPKSDRISPDSYDPFKIASICVSAIECLDDVQQGIEWEKRERFAHRDIKPENFLVRIDPKTNACKVVLGDLGLVRYQDVSHPHDSDSKYPHDSASTYPRDSACQSPLSSSVDSISESSSSISFSISRLLTPSSSFSFSVSGLSIPSSRSSEAKKGGVKVCGTLMYNAPESLQYGVQNAKSDAYALGLTIYALFSGTPPYFEIFKHFRSLTAVYRKLIDSMEKDIFPDIRSCPLFKKLRQSPHKDKGGGEVADCLQEVFLGLIYKDPKERMSVHKAREAIQKIKPLIPCLGDGIKCPSIEEIVARQLNVYDRDRGSIVDADITDPTPGEWDSMLSDSRA
ncbi:hypothetical protein ADUPG1_009522 [Aduncisulcus paluster]|uniref:Protein kinase domain-containing protein n=1 Tax=Aduncisulcus paluster TaxID=2918883 RepID=A0ABQ5KVW3_9EUKA|nr:hypothetical protein ADUPG1_009522 [Aduncisulcus paluster]